jgi:hypothetical protein
MPPTEALIYQVNQRYPKTGEIINTKVLMFDYTSGDSAA